MKFNSSTGSIISVKMPIFNDEVCFGRVIIFEFMPILQIVIYDGYILNIMIF